MRDRGSSLHRSSDNRIVVAYASEQTTPDVEEVATAEVGDIPTKRYSPVPRRTRLGLPLFRGPVGDSGRRMPKYSKTSMAMAMV